MSGTRMGVIWVAAAFLPQLRGEPGAQLMT